MVRVNTTLVTIPVSIVDRDGRFIPNLRKEDFRILEDGVEQEVAYFATVDKPFTVALVLDTSGSTRFKIEDMQDAAIAFLDELQPADRVLVVSFDGEIRVQAEVTSNRDTLRNAIRRTRTGGNTKLYDAVDFVIKQRLNRIDGRKAIVLFTDGVDTDSKRASYDSNVRDAEELDASIYPIQYDTYDANQGGGGGGGWPGGGGGRPSIRIGPITIPIPAPAAAAAAVVVAVVVAARARVAASISAPGLTCATSRKRAAGGFSKPTTYAISPTPSRRLPKNSDASTASAITPSDRRRNRRAAKSECASTAPTSPSAPATATSTNHRTARRRRTRKTTQTPPRPQNSAPGVRSAEAVEM